MCANCGTTQGPFYIVVTPLTGPSIRVCGPIKYEKETGRLIGRAADCGDRRRKLMLDMYGKDTEKAA